MSPPRAEVAGPADWPEISALRTRVFVVEQGVPPEIERDAADATALHAVSRDASGRVVATGRLVERDGVALIGRMAADPSVRGCGYGRAVLEELHWQAVLRGLREALLHAQVTARGFYERAGYAALGGTYREAGILHVTMRRPLPLLRPADGDEGDPILGRSDVPAKRWVLIEGGTVIAAADGIEGDTAGLGVGVGQSGWGPRLAHAALAWTLEHRRGGYRPPPWQRR